MEYTLATYLKGNISSGLSYSTPKHLSVAEALYDVQIRHGFGAKLTVTEGI